MDLLILSAVLVVVFLALLVSGVWVAFSLLAVGYLALELFTSVPVGQALTTNAWSASTKWSLAALPMFIWMGEILFRSRLSEDLFREIGRASCREGTVSHQGRGSRIERH